MAPVIGHSSPLSLDARGRAMIESATAHFVLDQGRVSLPAEKSLWTILNEVYATAQSIFALPNQLVMGSSPDSLRRILHAIFDTSARAFVLADSGELLARLDAPCAAILLAQAIAGLVLLLRRVAEAAAAEEGIEEVGQSAGLFARELQLFAESETRRRMLDLVERDGAALFGSCFLRTQISSLVERAVEERDNGIVELPMAGIGEELLHEGVAWVSDRPCRNMGVPWGFTIMALN